RISLKPLMFARQLHTSRLVEFPDASLHRRQHNKTFGEDQEFAQLFLQNCQPTTAAETHGRHSHASHE
ncbi:hypothetical protein SK128_021729, partial [Halocaridina rubra]